MLARTRSVARDRTLGTVAVLSVVGYALVLGTFAGMVPQSVFPELSLSEVNLLSYAIALINTVATVLLLLGWKWICEGRVNHHRNAMMGAFSLILVFLVLYLTKIGAAAPRRWWARPTSPIMPIC